MRRGPLNYQDLINWSHPLNRGLASWWMVLPQWRGGLTWRDLCGRHHGTLTNMDPATDWVGSSRPGGWGALDFVNGSNNRVVIPDRDEWTASRISIAMWFRQTVAGNYTLLHKGDGSSDAGSSLAILRYNAVVAELGFWVNNGNGWTMAHSGASYDDGQWHRVVGTFDSSFVRIYVDGAFKEETAFSGAINNNSQNLDLGWHLISGVPDLTGQLDDVRFWSGRTLSASDVAADYDQSRRYHEGTLNRISRRSYWFVDAGGGGAVHDIFGRYGGTIGSSIVRAA